MRRDLLLGAGLDLLFGDPRWLPHPVRGFGWAVTRLERIFRAAGLPLRLAGALFWVTAVSAATWLVWLTQPWANVYWIFSLLALRDLDNEASLVASALRRGDLNGAREKLSWIVGRDTAHLHEPEILRAAIETVAENLSDGVIAPLFYLGLAGPAGMAAYKAVNTLDSMVGYRNDRYRDFGWASARADDIANWAPARLSAILVCLVSGHPIRSLRAVLRDAARQPSPNSGYPEAAFAGALGVRLGGLNHYQGVPSEKPFLGDPLAPLSLDVFRTARRLLYATALLFLGILVLVMG
ncbi:MAG: cobalamin biosynthesis protein CobD [Bryobacterales bacterium]|nr:cobalamin biosynthesis protein CobD [Bryobacterales bacterium]